MVMVLVGTIAWAAERETFRYDAQGRRDPLEPLITPTGELRTPRSAGGAADVLHLEGILRDAARPLAIVNGEVHRVGDQVESCRIIEIQPNAVVVETGEGERTTLSVVVEEPAAAETSTKVSTEAHED